MRVLNTPPSETYIKLTFPEGFTVEQMANRVAAQIPTMTAEGVLLPPPSTPPSTPCCPRVDEPSRARCSRHLPGRAAETETRLVSRMEQPMDRVGGQLGFEQSGEWAVAPYEVLIRLADRARGEGAADRAKIARASTTGSSRHPARQIDATLLYGQRSTRGHAFIADAPDSTRRTTPT